MIKKWRTLARKELLNHNGFIVAEDTVQLPDGATTTYTHLGPAAYDAVIVIAVNQQGKVLVQREYSHPPQKIMWQLPGGKLEPDESIHAGANRELAEESNLQGKSLRTIGSFYVNNRLSDQRQHVVVAAQLFEHTLAQDSDEFIENHWFSVDQLLEKIATNQFDNINLLAALNLWLHNNKGSSK